MKILYTWTGYRELKEAGKKFPQYCTLIEEHIRNNQISGPRNGRSQVRLALEQQKYDKLVILIDFAGQNFLEAESDFIAAYKETFENYKCDVQVFPVVLSKAKNNNEYSEAEDYAIVYQKTKEILEQTKQEGADLFFLLSSGTHAMTTSLILLGKTLFDGAKFLRDNGKLTEFTIPFDMTIDLAPHFYGRQDNFQFKIPESFDDIIGNSPAIKEAERKAAKAAIHEVNVLLIGESGTGKELFARAIHHASKRRDKEMVSCNCASLSTNEDNAVSELCGYEGGTFTNAKSKGDIGLFDSADKSTLFFDEIGDMSLVAQKVLLRALQPPPNKSRTTRPFARYGGRGRKEEQNDIRLIAATNKDIEQLANEMDKFGINNVFRMDLLQRIGTIVIHIPPLRERKEDIELLARHFLDEINEEFRKDSEEYIDKKFSRKAINFLVNQEWRNTNVRGLQNAIYNATVMCDGEIIQPTDFGIPLEKSTAHQADTAIPDIPLTETINLNQILDDIKRKCILKTLELHPHNATKAANMLGLNNYQTLKAWMKKLGIQHDFR